MNEGEAQTEATQGENDELQPDITPSPADDSESARAAAEGETGAGRDERDARSGDARGRGSDGADERGGPGVAPPSEVATRRGRGDTRTPEPSQTPGDTPEDATDPVEGADSGSGDGGIETIPGDVSAVGVNTVVCIFLTLNNLTPSRRRYVNRIGL